MEISDNGRHRVAWLPLGSEPPPFDTSLASWVLVSTLFGLLTVCLAWSRLVSATATSRMSETAETAVFADEDPMDVDSPKKRKSLASTMPATLGLPFPGKVVNGVHAVVHYEL